MSDKQNAQIVMRIERSVCPTPFVSTRCTFPIPVSFLHFPVFVFSCSHPRFIFFPSLSSLVPISDSSFSQFHIGRLLTIFRP